MDPNIKFIFMTAPFIGVALLITKAYLKYKPTTPLRVYLVMPFFVLLIPLIAFIALICIIYRWILTSILSAKLGSKFGGLTEGCDAAFVVRSMAKYPSVILMMMQYDRKNPQPFYDAATEAIRRQLPTLSQIPKAFATFQRFMGYSYLLKDDVEFDECLKPLKKIDISGNEMTRADLMKLLGEVSCLPLPNNGQGLWDVMIGTQPVKWTKEARTGDTLLFPIFLRQHHALCDGYSLIKTIADIFVDLKSSAMLENPTNSATDNGAQVASPPDKVIEFSSTDDSLTEAFSTMKMFLSKLYLFCLCFTTYIVQKTYLANDSNVLHGPQLTTSKHLCYTPEESPRYIETVKRIKARVPNATFMDVLLTAISATFKDFYETRSGRVPVEITIAIPEISVAAAMDLEDVNRRVDKKDYFRNRLSFSLRKLPIIINEIDGEPPLITRLNLVKRKRHLIGPGVTEMNAWILTMIYGLLPEPVVEFIMEMLDYTMVVSNMPGPPHFTFHGGCYAEYTLPSAPHRERTGITLTFFTYRKRFQMTLAVDKALISEEQDVEGIANNVYRYLDLLDKETAGIVGKST